MAQQNSSPAPPVSSTGQPSPEQSAPTPEQTSNKASTSDQRCNLHAQSTLIFQGDGSFPAKYSGPNSLSDEHQIQHTLTADLFAGARLSDSTEAHMDFLMWQGFGLSNTLGIEAFPNADAYKLGTSSPNFTFARLFVRKTVGLGGPKEDISDDQLTLAGKEDVSRLTFTAGRFAMTDIFDNNAYASDPHTQFMNWAFVANLSWDYAADAVGYTTGLAAQLNQPKWGLSYAFFQMPKVPNSFTEDDQLLMWPHRGADGPFWKSWSMAWEVDRPYSIKAHPGTVRLLAWLNEADMATYQAETAILETEGPGANIAAARAFRYRWGYGLNWEQEVANNVGVFSRVGWNDGQLEPWAYTDVNWTASFGTSLNGAWWKRSGDMIGLAGVVSGASSQNQTFLESGGTGILDGDGALNYGQESVVETYYNARLSKTIQGAFDYQYVENPAFNRDRGPVNIFSLRLHTQF